MDALGALSRGVAFRELSFSSPLRYNIENMSKYQQLIFIDDSGDPGFKLKRGSSQLFVIACVIFDNPISAEYTRRLRRHESSTDFS